MTDAEVKSLDVVIARFVIPRLIEFRDHAESCPGIVAGMDAWRWELDRMIRAWQHVANREYNQETRSALLLFARRLPELWS